MYQQLVKFKTNTLIMQNKIIVYRDNNKIKEFDALLFKEKLTSIKTGRESTAGAFMQNKNFMKRPKTSINQTSQPRLKLNNLVSQKNMQGKGFKGETKTPTSTCFSPVTPGLNLK